MSKDLCRSVWLEDKNLSAKFPMQTTEPIIRIKSQKGMIQSVLLKLSFTPGRGSYRHFVRSTVTLSKE